MHDYHKVTVTIVVDRDASVAGGSLVIAEPWRCNCGALGENWKLDTHTAHEVEERFVDLNGHPLR